MNKLLLTACVCLVFSFSGCALSGNRNCDSGRYFGQRLMQRKTPVQDAIRGIFHGDACNTCNPPAGMPANCGTNVAPLCDTCDGATQTNPGIQFYGDPNLNAPMSSPSLVDPNLNNGNAVPTPQVGPVETGYTPSNDVIPPVF
ncbi:MAG: hypothetical protein P8J27_14830 [Mariniblastus sp.]|nr:hypothetical protein [Mariniblastus sp.]